MKKYSKGQAGTFSPNKDEAIHRWYPYIEGYSYCLIQELLDEIGEKNIHSVYDPFSGTGTTPLVAAHNGIQSFYSETNPFMREIIDAKINCVKRLRDSGVGAAYLKDFLKDIENCCVQLNYDDLQWDGFEKFFEPEVLCQLKFLLDAVHRIKDTDSHKIALAALASVTVRCSKMIRQGDLRFAKDREKSDADRDVLSNYIQKLRDVIEDIGNDDYCIKEYASCLSYDARDVDVESQIDCVITSPPYLNGTNYIRNTKLELKLYGFVDTEADLPALHSLGIIAGINSVSKRTAAFEVPDCVASYVEQLTPVTYDRRIPVMVAGYFHDMEKVIERLYHALKDEGIFIMDIGDSQFAGVHIPTHAILAQICERYGFELYDEEILRERRSKNGMVLSQRLMKFKLHKNGGRGEIFKGQAGAFIRNMPYKQSPYAGRNWGHAWHSLCSYHGKLKPAIAHFLVEQFTNVGDVVADPLCGVGTIPFEACLQGRIGLGNDLSEMAYVVTKAKLEKPDILECQKVIEDLKVYLMRTVDAPEIDSDIRKYESFGFNGKLHDYFHPDTYRELLCARRYFVKRINHMTSAEAMVFSCLLHILHGNRPYALSRTSHPLTPYAPKGDFIYKNVVEHIMDKLNLSYSKGDFTHYRQGQAIFGDYSRLSGYGIKADVIISSPPFADSLKFYMQNWMRLWLCGWESQDYKDAEIKFLDQKQKKNFNVYSSFFEVCSRILKPDGKVILHLGKTDKVDMAEELSKQAAPYFLEVYRGSENVQDVEKHGVKDKGATLEHQFLFLIKK